MNNEEIISKLRPKINKHIQSLVESEDDVCELTNGILVYIVPKDVKNINLIGRLRDSLPIKTLGAVVSASKFIDESFIAYAKVEVEECIGDSVNARVEIGVCLEAQKNETVK